MVKQCNASGSMACFLTLANNITTKYCIIRTYREDINASVIVLSAVTV